MTAYGKMHLKDGWYCSKQYGEYLLAIRNGCPVIWFNIDAGAKLGIGRPIFSQSNKGQLVDGCQVFAVPARDYYENYSADQFKYDLEWPDEWVDLLVVKL